jgi:excisionase family DNA binding protein
VARDNFYTVTEAREVLGISKSKMVHLLKDGTLEFVRNPLDKRRKLVRRAHLEELLKFRETVPTKHAR